MVFGTRQQDITEIKDNVDTILTNVATLLTRLSSDRAGYLDNINQAGLLQLTATRVAYLDELAAANLPADITTLGTNIDTLLARLTAVRAGYLDALNRDRPDMIFPSTSTAIIVLPAAAGDVAFPSVTVDKLPSGITVAKADYVSVIGALSDTSGSENQVNAAGKTIRGKLSTAGWAAAIVALTFTQNGLQCDASSYRGGVPLFGATDISSLVTGNATYNFQSDQSTHAEGVTVTGASLELLDVTSIIRVWFN